METTTIKLRKAAPEDLKVNANTLRYGQPFWLRSKIDHSFDNAPYIITEDVDVHELAMWLKNEMIYVPVSSLDAGPKNQRS